MTGVRTRAFLPIILGLLFLLGVSLACDTGEQTITPPTLPNGQQPAVDGSAPTQNTVFLPNLSPGEGATPVPGAAQTGQSPHIEISANPVELKVGETLTVTGKAVAIGLPYYQLIVQDEGAQQSVPLAQVTYENKVTLLNGSSQVVEFVSAQGQMEQAVFVLQAKAAGKTTININATGEVKSDSGAYTWSGGGSQGISITVLSP